MYVCTLVCMYVQPQEPMRAEGPKECLTTHSSYGTVFGRVVEQDHMWQATKFQTLIYSSMQRKVATVIQAILENPWHVIEIHLSPL